jgi:beta-hydroxylase
MLSALIIIFCFAIFPAMSLIYIYQYRGTVRYTGWVEYLRKGWPIFAPLNVFLYMMSKKKAKSAIIKLDDFPELAVIAENWETIHEEAKALLENGYFDATKNKDNMSHYDVGFRTFYKYGWSKFYVSWYGTTHKSAEDLCPKTTQILKDIKSINASMFTILPGGGQLTRHLDPLACSLRYHIGLDTPNSDDCFINVDGNQLSWRDGEAFMFDETYLHYVKNNTDSHRLILMCDIERPMNVFGKIFNVFYRRVQAQMLTPNLADDKAGTLNKIFRNVTPFLAWSKELKKTNRRLYLPLKWTFNTLLLLILISILSGITFGIIGLFSLFLG